MTAPDTKPSRWGSLMRWFDAGYTEQTIDPDKLDHIDWVKAVPFIALHLACFAVIWVGFSWVALGIAVALYFARMFFITSFYHRYFSHRSFRTTRPFQFIMGALTCTAFQRGPLWWAGHHRIHHNHSDQQPDPHSPRWYGFLWSHTLWFLTNRNFVTPKRYVRDWIRFPELRLLDRFEWLPGVVLVVGLYLLGEWLAGLGLATGGWQLVVWGGIISTVVLYHATYTINSLAHQFGSQRYDTDDDSRNNFWLALLTLGEGWHNNHHHYPAAARQGFYWWEVDISYYGLLLLQKLGLIWDVRGVPQHVLAEGEAARATTNANAQRALRSKLDTGANA